MNVAQLGETLPTASGLKGIKEQTIERLSSIDLWGQFCYLEFSVILQQ